MMTARVKLMETQTENNLAKDRRSFKEENILKLLSSYKLTNNATQSFDVNLARYDLSEIYRLSSWKEFSFTISLFHKIDSNCYISSFSKHSSIFLPTAYRLVYFHSDKIAFYKTNMWIPFDMKHRVLNRVSSSSMLTLNRTISKVPTSEGLFNHTLA